MESSKTTEEPAFLQNGHIDDVGPQWTATCGNAMGFSATLTKPAWVSHAVLYLNNATPERVYRTISVWANNLETKIPESVALVRNNRRRFLVIHFPEPLRTDAVFFMPYQQTHGFQDSITEIELYGPLGGPEMQKNKRFTDDPDAWPMLMARPSHVPAAWPADLTGTYEEKWRGRSGHTAYHVDAIVSDGAYSCGDANGSIVSLIGPDPKDPRRRHPSHGPRWNLASITPTTTPTRYAGRLLVGSADNRMHAVADNGTHLWAFPTGGRIYSSPVPRGDDVFFGSDDGSLYRVDVDAGTLIWEFKTLGRIRSAPALVKDQLFFASWDGHLYSVHADRGKMIWKAPIAPFTRAAPAVHEGVVVLGDESGQLWAFDARDGKVKWKHQTKGRFSTCPIVTPTGVAFVGDNGLVAFVDQAGALAWQVDLDLVVNGQTIGTQSQLLIPTSQGLRVLRQADGQPAPRVVLPEGTGPIATLVPYKDRLFLVASSVEVKTNDGLSFTYYHSMAYCWGPAPPEK